MNNNGFIATSLIYSFFLILCAVLLAFTSNSIHNKNLLNRSMEDAREDLSYKKIDNADDNSYIKLNLISPNYNIDNINWMIFKKDNSGIYLVADDIINETKLIEKNDIGEEQTITLSEAINKVNNILSSFSNVCFIDDMRLPFDSEISEIENTDKANFVGLNKNFTIIKENIYYNNNNLTSEISGSDSILVRPVIVISNNSIITSGSGSIMNPYHILGC